MNSRLIPLIAGALATFRSVAIMAADNSQAEPLHQKVLALDAATST